MQLGSDDDDDMGLDILLSGGPTHDRTPSETSSEGELEDKSSNDDSDSSSIVAAVEQQHKRGLERARTYNAEEISEMKRAMLIQLDKLQSSFSKGREYAKRFTMSSSFDDIKTELERLKHEREVASSVRFQKMVFSTCVHGIEMLNKRYDPFDVKLDGWAENVHENMTDYEEIFEELHEKYKGRGKFAPEIKLMFMLGGSAVKFHFMNKLLNSSFPSIEQVINQNPDLMRQFAQAASSATQASSPQPPTQQGGGGGLFGALGSIFGGGGFQGPAQQPSPPPQEFAPKPEAPKMRGPAKNILDDIIPTGDGQRGDDESISVVSVETKKKRQPRATNARKTVVL